MLGVKEMVKRLSRRCGEYVRLRDFDVYQHDDGISEKELFPYDDISIEPSRMGELVECLTRFMLSGDKNKAFCEAMAGAKYAFELGFPEVYKDARKLLNGIRGLGDASIENANALLTFKSWFFKPPLGALYGTTAAMFDKAILSQAAENVRIFVKRSVEFFREHGPVVGAPVIVEAGAIRGIIDFLTADAIFDMKLYKGRILDDAAMQVLLYWIMGKHSGNELFRGITKLGLFNPRTNRGYILPLSRVRFSVIAELEEELGYSVS